MSFIREFLIEAVQDMQVAPDPSQVSESPATPVPMDDSNFARAPEPSTATQMIPPTMPTMDNIDNPTTQKEVVNPALVLAITRELKAIVSAAEKEFDDKDVTPDSTKIYIMNFLKSLASCAEKLKEVAGLSENRESGEEAPMPETPVEAPPEQAPAEGEMTEPMEAAGQPQGTPESDMTEPGMTPLPQPEFTSPNEAI